MIRSGYIIGERNGIKIIQPPYGCIIKENKDGKFAAVYIYTTPENLTLKEELLELVKEPSATVNDLRECLDGLFESSKKKCRPTQFENIAMIEKFINFEKIREGLEIYIILFKNGDITIFLNILSNFISGAIKVKFSDEDSDVLSLYYAIQEVDCLERVIEVYEVLKKIKKEAKREIEKAYKKLLNGRFSSILSNCEIILAKTYWEANIKDFVD